MRNLTADEIKDDIEVSFSDSNILEIDGHIYIEFNDLVLKSRYNPNKDMKIINGKVMPIFFSNKYFHMLLDNVALAEYSKSIINNLNFQFFVAHYPIHEAIGNGELTNDPSTFLSYLNNKGFNNREFFYDEKNNFEYFKDIFNLYKNDYLIYDQTIHTKIETCMLFVGDDKDLFNLYNTDKKAFVRYCFAEGTRDYGKGYTDKKWVLEGIKILKERLQESYPTTEKNKKIYTSRSHASKLYEKDKFSQEMILSDENKIESMFLSAGFEIIYLEGMSFVEQYKLFNEASHIAGYNGTNLLNTILCGSPVNIIEIVPENKDGYFDYATFARIFNHDHKFLFEKDLLMKGSIS